MAPKSAPTLSDPLRRAVSTFNDERSPLVGEANSWRQEWLNVIEFQLVAWEHTSYAPDALDEGLVAPSRLSIKLARHLAFLLKEKGDPPPSRVAPDGDGGLVFELFRKQIHNSLRFNSTGSIAELLTFHNSKLVHRETFVP